MTRRISYIVLLLTCLNVANVFANPKRVLLLCDPVQQQIAQEAVKGIEGAQATVPKNLSAYYSAAVLKQLDEVLGDGEWDVIYLNFGIADLMHRDPSTQDTRLMNKDAGGKPTPIGEYVKNLDQIIQRLKKTKAKLVWGSSTPLVNVHFFPTFEGGLFEASSEIEYNRKAAELMQRYSIQVVDLHAHVMKNFGKDEKHPSYPTYAKAMKDKGMPLHVLLSEAFVK